MRLFLSLLLLSLLAYAGYLGLGWVSGQYALLPPAEQPRMALIAVLTITGVLLLTGAIRYAIQYRDQRGLPEERYRLYLAVLNALQQQGTETASPMENHLRLALLGSKNVLRAYRQLEEERSGRSLTREREAALLRALALAMRADLLQSNFDLRPELNYLLRNA